MAHPRGAAIIRTTPPTGRLRLRYAPVLIRQSGVGGWVERPHDRGKASTEWAGTPLHTMTLGLFFDEVRSGRGDVEADLATLARLASPSTTDGEPPVVRLNFGHDRQLVWVIDAIIYGSVLTDPRTARRVQATVDVSLLEYRRAVLALSPVEAAEAAADEDGSGDGAPPAAARTYTVRAGDTLSRIAAAELGNAARWPEIYQLNTPVPLANPDLIFPGQVLKLPAG